MGAGAGVALKRVDRDVVDETGAAKPCRGQDSRRTGELGYRFQRLRVPDFEIIDFRESRRPQIRNGPLQCGRNRLAAADVIRRLFQRPIKARRYFSLFGRQIEIAR